MKTLCIFFLLNFTLAAWAQENLGQKVQTINEQKKIAESLVSRLELFIEDEKNSKSLSRGIERMKQNEESFYKDEYNFHLKRLSAEGKKKLNRKEKQELRKIKAKGEKKVKELTKAEKKQVLKAKKDKKVKSRTIQKLNLKLEEVEKKIASLINELPAEHPVRINYRPVSERLTQRKEYIKSQEEAFAMMKPRNNKEYIKSKEIKSRPTVKEKKTQHWWQKIIDWIKSFFS